MGETVVPQVVRPAKSFVTLVAWEGTLVRVSSLVDLKVVALCELPMAELANVSLARLFTLKVGSSGDGSQEELLEVVGEVVEAVWVEGQGEGGHGGGALMVRPRLNSSTVAPRFITLLLNSYQTTNPGWGWDALHDMQFTNGFASVPNFLSPCVR